MTDSSLNPIKSSYQNRARRANNKANIISFLILALFFSGFYVFEKASVLQTIY